MHTFFTRIKIYTVWLINVYKKNRKRFWLVGVIFLVLGFFIGQVAPPIDFPSDATIQISSGASARAVANKLSRNHIINSPTAFVALTHVMNVQGDIKNGTYHFSTPMNLFSIVNFLKEGAQDVSMRITFPEGITVKEMAPIISKAIPNITENTFIKVATPYEGYLFPDTYDFSSNETVQQIIKRMRNNFDIRIASITPYIVSSGHSQKDIIIMASLIEKEARTLNTRRTIAGILFNRLHIGMPLQVDAVFSFIFNKPTNTLSTKDFHVQSPYNTYIHRGLPPTPIDNPGSDSIFAAATAINTKYLYYITGNDGKMHYSKTLAGHEMNMRRFLH